MERITHDMSSLLASILGYASLVADTDLRCSDANLEVYGKVIVKQTLRLQRMVEESMTVTRIAENRLDMVLNPVRLEALLKAVVSEAREQSGREICFHDEGVAHIVLADSLCLGEAFNQIIDNAFKFSAPGAPVEIRIAKDETNTRVEIRVEDHGIGIDEADLSHLFRPFGRICNDQTRSLPGNGLGLYIAREIVIAHQGEIVVQSRPGQGSVFSIFLPSMEGLG
jgi:signal transduction histidine kinase